jgi:hypothetical protein
VQNAQPAEPSEIVEGRRRNVLPLHGTAEDGSEFGPSRAEVRRRHERDVDLEAAREEEHAVHGRAGADVPVVEDAKLLVDQLGPFGQHALVVDAVGHSEKDVDVGPPILRALGR